MPIEILLVEDNPADVDLARETLAASKIANRLSAVSDGSQALRFLRQEGEHADAPRPDLVLLDLNLPNLNGRDVLDTIKKDPGLRRIPTVVLSSSDAERDILASYELGANCYVVKPVDLEQFERIVQTIEDFWFSVVKLPPR